MIRLVLGRLLSGVVLVLLLSLMTFVVFFRVPVDPTIYISPIATAEEKAEIRRVIGLDQPVLEEWGDFVWGLGTRGDLGRELFPKSESGVITLEGERRPVSSTLKEYLPATLSLVVGGFVLMLALALPLGLLSALHARSLVDRAILVFTVLGIVLHPFLVGLILRETFADRLELAPPGGYCPIRGENAEPFSPGASFIGTCGGVVDWLDHMWLPWLTFALFFLPLYTRMVRARVLDNLGQLYVLAARAKGASEWRIVTRHVSRNSLGPIVAMLAVDIAVIVTAAIYVETIFGLDGVGRLVASNLSGAGGYDIHVLVGIVVVVAVAITAVNIFSDLAVRALDPRIRTDATR